MKNLKTNFIALSTVGLFSMSYAAQAAHSDTTGSIGVNTENTQATIVLSTKYKSNSGNEGGFIRGDRESKGVAGSTQPNAG